ncbi:MAG TPA: tetratricopeptide repeat protein, partial [Pyrinomonadaceae bacterium]|nr:tetratricopeptide repeat protein [Pyrinomonadaceae bacterium]
FRTALKFYEEALKIAPEFPEAEFQKGSALQSLGRDLEAEKSYRKATELKENWVLPLASLGELLVRFEKFEEAEAVLNKVLQLDESNQSAFLSLTTLRIKTKASAVILKNLLAKLNSLQNPSASIWTARGAIEKELGDQSAAKSNLSRALALEPKNSYALTELAEISLAEKNYSTALQTAQTLVKFYPNSISGNLLIARVYAENGKIDEAFKIIDSLDGQNQEVIKFRNTIIANSSTDISALEKQIETEPKNANLLGRLCILTRTNPAKALEYCRRANEAEPTNISHAIGFGAALLQAKQFENAAVLLKKLLAYAPDNYTIHANLATALFELKQFALAKTEFQWLIEKRSDLAVAYYFLAITHDNLAEYTDARTNYQKFLQIADSKQYQLEIDKVNLRLPILEKQIKNGDGVKKGGKNE